MNFGVFDCRFRFLIETIISLLRTQRALSSSVKNKNKTKQKLEFSIILSWKWNLLVLGWVFCILATFVTFKSFSHILLGAFLSNFPRNFAFWRKGQDLTRFSEELTSRKVKETRRENDDYEGTNDASKCKSILDDWMDGIPTLDTNWSSVQQLFSIIASSSVATFRHHLLKGITKRTIQMLLLLMTLLLPRTAHVY